MVQVTLIEIFHKWREHKGCEEEEESVCSNNKSWSRQSLCVERMSDALIALDQGDDDFAVRGDGFVVTANGGESYSVF